MFGLIRRISHSVIPRPDRPWADDATSNAPTKGKKRRLSSTEREQDPDAEESSKKKIRGESTVSDAPGTPQLLPQPESAGLKEVTKGVKEVELSDAPATIDVAPEAVPLPAEEEAGELEEPPAVSPPLEAEADPPSDDVASSVDGETNQAASADSDAVAEPSQPTDQEKVTVTEGNEEETPAPAPAVTQVEYETEKTAVASTP